MRDFFLADVDASSSLLCFDTVILVTERASGL